MRELIRLEPYARACDSNGQPASLSEQSQGAVMFRLSTPVESDWNNLTLHIIVSSRPHVRHTREYSRTSSYKFIVVWGPKGVTCQVTKDSRDDLLQVEF